MSENKIYPFNNGVDTGLRMLTLLNAAYPLKYDLDHLVYFDYMIVHSGDIDPETTSLHPAVPNRTGEIFIRRNLIQQGLEVFIHKGLVNRYYNTSGIQYGATEIATPFLDSLSEAYSYALMERANWVAKNFAQYDSKTLREVIAKNLSKVRNEFNLEILK
jgi:hypothetical protein